MDDCLQASSEAVAEAGSGNGFTVYSGNGAEAGSAACERPSWNPFQHQHQ